MILKEKECYILLRVDKDHKLSDQRPTYTALLDNECIITENFISKLNALKKGKQSAGTGKNSKSKNITPTRSRLKNIIAGTEALTRSNSSKTERLQ